jgi:hypothetical protein
MTTTWTWDTAANGIGRLHKLTSPDGEKVFAYNPRGQLAGLTLSVTGTDALLEGKLAGPRAETCAWSQGLALPY